MQPRIRIDTREFSATARQLSILLKKSGKDVLKRVAVNFVKDCIKFTPPFGSGTSQEPWSNQRKVGENAVVGDLVGGTRGGEGRTKRAGIFTGVDERILAMARENPDLADQSKKLFVTKDGRVYGAERLLLNLDGDMEDMRSHHKRYFRNGRMTSAGTGDRQIGRWVWIDKMVVPKSALNKYIKQAQKMVGYAKSGWKKAASRLGLKLPMWIARHNGNGGYVESQSNVWPRIFVSNEVEYIQAAGGQLRIIQRAMTNRIRSMRKEIEIVTRKQFEKLRGRRRKTA